MNKAAEYEVKVGELSEIRQKEKKAQQRIQVLELEKAISKTERQEAIREAIKTESQVSSKIQLMLQIL